MLRGVYLWLSAYWGASVAWPRSIGRIRRIIAEVDAIIAWRNFSLKDEAFDIGVIVNDFGRGILSEDEQNAYRAPFPDNNYKAGARKFPSLVPSSTDDPAREANIAAWDGLKTWSKPFLCCFSDKDPITGGGEKVFFKLVPGCEGQPHTTLHGGHFIQQDDGGALVNHNC